MGRRGDQSVDQAALLASHYLFRGLSAEIRERLGSYARLKSFKRGATIFSKGDAGACLYAVCSGTVQMTTLSPNGKNAVFNRIKEGEIFGEIALLDGKPRTADAIAFTDCSLLVIDRRDFVPLMHSHPELAIQMIEVLCGRLRRTTEQVEDLMFLDLKSRLVKTLLSLANAAPGHEITISQDELSRIVGLSREMINKQLREWSKKKLISLARKRIIVLEPEVLGKLVEGE